MATFTIQAPDGRKIKIQATDQATAIRGAQEWARANPAPQATTAIQRAEQRAIAAARETVRQSNLYEQRQRGLTPEQARRDRDRNTAREQGYLFGFADELGAAGQAFNTAVYNAIGKGKGYSPGQAYKAYQRAYQEDDVAYSKAHPVESAANRVVGGALNPLNYAGGGLIARGATIGAKVARAAGVNALAGAAYGAGDAGPGRRGQGAAVGAGVGAAAGSGGQALASAARPVVGAVTRAISPQRQLSRAGVNLTPGQMVGGVARSVEDVAAGIPGLGVRNARVRQNAQINRIVADRTLAPLNETVPRNVRPGRDMVRHVRERISRAYDAALSPHTVAPDQQFTQAVAQARSKLKGVALDDFDTIINNSIGERFTGPVNGRVLKELDEELGKAARAALGPNSRPQDRYLASALNEVQDALDGALGRVSPEALAAKNAADEAFSSFIRMEGASAASGARRGVFTPAQLQNAVRSADPTKRKGQFARGDALLQDITDPAMDVLPSTIPDSGTPVRLLAMGGAGAAGTVFAAPVMAKIAAGMLASNVTYSRPVIAALNAVYRATDGAQTQAAIARLGELAARHPEAQAAYSELLRQARDQGGAQPASQQ